MKSIIIQYLPMIVTFTCLQIIGLISPGPDFAITVRNSLLYSRKIGLFTALGISCGIMVHVVYTILGVGFFIAKTPWLFTLFKYLGAAYLFYIGFKGLIAKKRIFSVNTIEPHNTISSMSAFWLGFLTNALNPKAMLFFVSLFTVFLAPKTPPVIMIIYGAIVFMTTLVWFVFVSLCLSHETIRSLFGSVSHWVERITGVVLILLAFKLLVM